ncbi:N-acetylneuraminate synthase [Rhizobium sp. BK077]|jgi:sialic acid synthase SpsE|nr:N-acetylneuraminate synthase [Rhizobium sp. BK112]MBB3367050.1 N-acetylneuraminate synthase [Rhizobium sp. BK077]MBB4177952.1 N-acetylneuraminate synthase [Rhizobium sp. BK109]
MFTDVNLRSIRPGFGMKAKHFDTLLGRRAARDIAFGKPLDASMIEGGFEA